MGDILKLIITENPGIVNIIFTAVLLPLGILYLTNSHARKLKEVEKKLEIKYKSKDDVREQEKNVYAGLSKILFEVQQLHVSLSGTCVDSSCIKNGLDRFDTEISKCHGEISKNMLYLSSNSINLIYQFYNTIGQLKIQLQELDSRSEYGLANATVYFSAQNLAENIIEIQELFLSERIDLKVYFDKTKQEMMKYCCGKEPPKELRDKYEQLKEALSQ